LRDDAACGQVGITHRAEENILVQTNVGELRYAGRADHDHDSRQPIHTGAQFEEEKMRGLLRHQPSPALVVACIALAVALGGTSYAAISLPKSSVGTKQLKKNAVTSPKVKNNTIKGVDVLESSLGRVPSAADAANAAHATNADNTTNATNATNSTNANALNGRAANGLVRAASGLQATSLQTPPSTASVTAAEATITAPGPGYVVVTGAIDLTLISGPVGNIRGWVRDSVGASSPVLLRSTDVGADLSPTYVFAVSAAGTKTYQLQFRSGGASWTWQGDNGMITALYVPFDGSGNTP
jgi:hypothetical protein